MEHGHVHDVTLDDTPPGYVEVKVQQSKVSAPQFSTRLLVCQVDVSIPGWDECLEHQRLCSSGSPLHDRHRGLLASLPE